MPLDIAITDQDLPVLSTIATQAIELLADPNVNNKKIDELIRQDLALTERVMRTANSPFYGGRRQTTTISDAIFRLGLRQLRNVLVVAATGELFSGADPVIQALWEHGLACAMASQILADACEIVHKEEAFIAGMLHDVGQLIIYRQHPEAYGALLAEAREGGRPLPDVEAEHLQYFTHMSVGGLVVRKWRLADSVAEAARFHHDVEREVPRPVVCKALVCVVSLADILVEQLGRETPAVDWDGLEALACSQFLNLGRARLEPLLPRLTAALARISHQLRRESAQVAPGQGFGEARRTTAC